MPTISKEQIAEDLRSFNILWEKHITKLDCECKNCSTPVKYCFCNYCNKPAEIMKEGQWCNINRKNIIYCKRQITKK